MSREINDKFDALFVEGPDDGAAVNALVKRYLGVDLSEKPFRLVRTKKEGAGDAWALREFESYISKATGGSRVGLIVDRDEISNDKWRSVAAVLGRLCGQTPNEPASEGAIVSGRHGIWMWPDNVSHGDVETFIAGLIPRSTLFDYAVEACRIAKVDHNAEYEPRHARKAALKVRSVWRDASAAGGYGHIIRNLPLVETAASRAFLNWFTNLFLT